MTRTSRFALAMAFCCAAGAAATKTVYQDLHDFAGGGNDGDTAYSALVADSQGRLYGVTYRGGSFDGGTLYRVTLPAKKSDPATIEILHSFSGSEGANPFGDVLIGADGAAYGTAVTGGAHNVGTVWRVDPTTLVTTDLHDFDPGASPPDGGSPQSGLAAGPGGLLYGTTAENGPLGRGTVFAISPQGDAVSYATIYDFGAPDDGSRPVGGPLVVTGKTLFGTTIFGGGHNGFDAFGVAFQLSLAKAGKWKETGLYAFGSQSNDAIGPGNGLALAKSGAIYGCAADGADNRGAVYSITPGKGGGPLTETVIYSFSDDFGDPYVNGDCGVTVDGDGRIVGTTSGGGVNLSGAVFTLTSKAGVWILNVPYSFGVRADGAATGPVSGVVGAGKGSYVGATPVGGAHDKGAVYSVKIPASP
jgi:uncharacterized repeat protein (TIGR03803 family)